MIGILEVLCGRIRVVLMLIASLLFRRVRLELPMPGSSYLGGGGDV